MNLKERAFMEVRLMSLRMSQQSLAKLENKRRRHPAYKQLHGRILELQYVLKKIDKGEI